jgi:hypothetical protein
MGLYELIVKVGLNQVRGESYYNFLTGITVRGSIAAACNVEIAVPTNLGFSPGSNLKGFWG